MLLIQNHIVPFDRKPPIVPRTTAVHARAPTKPHHRQIRRIAQKSSHVDDGCRYTAPNQKPRTYTFSPAWFTRFVLRNPRTLAPMIGVAPRYRIRTAHPQRISLSTYEVSADRNWGIWQPERGNGARGLGQLKAGGRGDGVRKAERIRRSLLRRMVGGVAASPEDLLL